MSECQRELREAGKPYPRTCRTCKLGPCVKGLDKPAAMAVERDALRDEVTKLEGERIDLLGRVGALERERDQSEERYQRDCLGLDNEGDPIGGDPPAGWKPRALAAEAALATAHNKAIRAAVAVCKRVRGEAENTDEAVGALECAVLIADLLQPEDHIVDANKMVTPAGAATVPRRASGGGPANGFATTGAEARWIADSEAGVYDTFSLEIADTLAELSAQEEAELDRQTVGYLRYDGRDG